MAPPPQAPIDLPWLRRPRRRLICLGSDRRKPGIRPVQPPVVGRASRARFRCAGPGPTVGPVRLGPVCALFCTLICSLRASRLALSELLGSQKKDKKRSRAYPALRLWRGGRRRWTPSPPSLTRLAVCDLIRALIRSLRASRLDLSELLIWLSRSLASRLARALSRNTKSPPELTSYADGGLPCFSGEVGGGGRPQLRLRLRGLAWL